MHFAALRFSADENLKGRLYWYLSAVPLKEGEEVLAPVGPHDRLQKGICERTLTADGEHAPYDLSLIKKVAAPWPLAPSGEFGGRKYDDRHYTRFGVLQYCENLPETSDMGGGESVLNGKTVLYGPKAGDIAVYRAVYRGHGTVLFGGEGKIIMEILLKFLKKDGAAEGFLAELGLGENERRALTEKLG